MKDDDSKLSEVRKQHGFPRSNLPFSFIKSSRSASADYHQSLKTDCPCRGDGEGPEHDDRFFFWRLRSDTRLRRIPRQERVIEETFGIGTDFLVRKFAVDSLSFGDIGSHIIQ